MKRKTKCIYKDNKIYVVNMFIVNSKEEAEEQINTINTTIEWMKTSIKLNEFVLTNNVFEDIQSKGFGIIEHYMDIDSYCMLLSFTYRIPNKKQFWLIYKTILNFYKTTTKESDKNYFKDTIHMLQELYLKLQQEEIKVDKFHIDNVLLGLEDEELAIIYDEDTNEYYIEED